MCARVCVFGWGLWVGGGGAHWHRPRRQIGLDGVVKLISVSAV